MNEFTNYLGKVYQYYSAFDVLKSRTRITVRVIDIRVCMCLGKAMSSRTPQGL